MLLQSFLRLLALVQLSLQRLDLLLAVQSHDLQLRLQILIMPHLVSQLLVELVLDSLENLLVVVQQCFVLSLQFLVLRNRLVIQQTLFVRLLLKSLKNSVLACTLLLDLRVQLPILNFQEPLRLFSQC